MPTKKSSSGKAVRRLERDKMRMDLLTQALKSFTHLGTELIRTANANPVTGLTVSLLTVMLPGKFRLLTPQEVTGMFVALGAIEGSAVASRVISEVVPWDLAKKGVDNIQPTVTTLSYGGGSDE